MRDGLCVGQHCQYSWWCLLASYTCQCHVLQHNYVSFGIWNLLTLGKSKVYFPDYYDALVARSDLHVCRIFLSFLGLPEGREKLNKNKKNLQILIGLPMLPNYKRNLVHMSKSMFAQNIKLNWFFRWWVLFIVDFVLLFKLYGQIPDLHACKRNISVKYCLLSYASKWGKFVEGAFLAPSSFCYRPINTALLCG